MGVMSQRVVPGTFLRGTYLSSYFAFLNPRVNKWLLGGAGGGVLSKTKEKRGKERREKKGRQRAKKRMMCFYLLTQTIALK